MSVNLLILMFSSICFAQDAAKVDWKDMIVTPAADIRKNEPVAAAKALQKKELDYSDESKIKLPEYSMSIVTGFITPSPISKFKIDFAAGLGFQWFKGLNIELLGVLPAQVHISAAWLFRFFDDRTNSSNTAFYAGLSVLANGADILPSLVDPRKYAPTFGFRFYHRKEKEFTGLLLDNRYEISLDDGLNLRILFLIGYFFPL